MKSKLLLAVAAAVALQFGAGAAWAQAAPPPSAERLRLARAVFEAQGGEENMKAIMRQATASMASAMARQVGQYNETTAVTIRKASTEVLEAMIPKILDIQVATYADTFDEKQLSDILAFYQSPTGQVLRARLPEIAGKAAVQIAALTPAIQLQILEKVCAQITCSDAQQKVLADLKRRVGAATAP